MADIQAFRGWRYDLAQVGSLSQVVAPALELIDGSCQSRLHGKSDYNIIRVILNRGDDLLGEQSVHDRAAEHLKHWRRDGILKQENVGTVYVYHQTFQHEGQSLTRRGFVARVRLEPSGAGSVFPCEETDSAASEDRRKLMHACQGNFSPVVGLYPDPDNQAQDVLETAVQDRTPLTAIDESGVRHELWMVTDPDAISAAANIVGTAPMHIVAGQDEYRAACNIRDRRRQDESITGEHAVDYTMMLCVGMDDPGLAVVPTHRLFRGFNAISSAELIEKLGHAFECEQAATGAEAAESVWEVIAVEGNQSTLGLYCRKDSTWVLARLTQQGVDSLAETAPEQSEERLDLGVVVLHRLVMKELLASFGCSGESSAEYVQSVSELVQALKQDDADESPSAGDGKEGGPYELACLVLPATPDHIKMISENGESLPAKSACIYPPPVSGLVINTLE